jgi:hypothetical protein
MPALSPFPPAQTVSLARQRVFTEKIVKEAFEGGGGYSLIVDTAEDFTNQAMSADFNTAVLFETDERLDQAAGLGALGSGQDTRGENGSCVDQDQLDKRRGDREEQYPAL